MSKAHDFYEALYGSVTAGLVEIRLLRSWEQGNKQVSQFWTPPDQICTLLRGLWQKEDRDFYFGVCPRSSKQGTEEAVCTVPALWVDLDAKDFDGGKEEALGVLQAWQHPPSVIVDSGNGYHAYWLLREPEGVSTQDERLHVKGYLKGLTEALGGDHTFDLSRILRVPETVNKKDPENHKAVQIVELNPERRYNLSDFEDYWVEARPSPVAVDLSESAEIPDRFWVLVRENTRLKATWYGERDDLKDQSRSGYEMSLASILTLHGFSDREIAAIIRKAPSGKGDEASDQYLSHTIGKARAGYVDLPPARTEKVDLPLPGSEAEELPAWFGQLEERQVEGDFVGLDSGFPHFNNVCNGLIPGLFVIAGPTSCGKTTLVKQLVDQVAKINEVPCLFFSLEQSKEELRIKTLSRLSGVENRDILRGRLRGYEGEGLTKEQKEKAELWAQVVGAYKEYGSWSQWVYVIEADRSTTVSRIEEMASRIMRRTGASQCFIVIDYLQKMPTEQAFGTTKDKIDFLTSELRRLARTLNSPVMVVSSENRAGYDTNRLDVFKESGEIEYSADIAGILTRENIVETRVKEKGEGKEKSFLKQGVTLHIAKNRNGERASIRFKFLPELSMFKEDTKDIYRDESEEYS